MTYDFKHFFILSSSKLLLLLAGKTCLIVLVALGKGSRQFSCIGNRQHDLISFCWLSAIQLTKLYKKVIITLDSVLHENLFTENQLMFIHLRYFIADVAHFQFLNIGLSQKCRPASFGLCVLACGCIRCIFISRLSQHGR